MEEVRVRSCCWFQLSSSLDWRSRLSSCASDSASEFVGVG